MNTTSTKLPTAGLLLAIVACIQPGLAGAAPNIVQNPSFESGSSAPWAGDFGRFLGVPYAAEGRNFATVNISAYQDLVTIPGATYRLQFWMAGNPNWSDWITMNVSWGGSLVTTTQWHPAGHSFANGLGWFTTDLVVTADSSTSRLLFQNPGSPTGMPFLDAVSVTLVAVPEPGTVALLALGGVLLAGIRVSRRTRP